MGKTITVILRGGLGNQMFQYAAGLSLARQSGAQLILDKAFLNDRFPRPQFTYRTYTLDIFDIEPTFTALSKISSRIPIPGFWLGADLIRYGVEDVLGIRKLIREKQSYLFDVSIYHTAKSVGSTVLWGLWQSEKYFAACAADIRSAFRFRDPLVGEVARLAKEIEKTNSISLHVRRGDYLLPKYSKIYGATDVEYYKRAISYIVERVKNPAFFIFSNDIAWCREHIQPLFPTVYMEDAFQGPKSSFHLQLMSQCKHNIIANSSFSWWAAWLNRNPGKIIIAPKEWQVGRLISADALPEDWVAM